MNLNSLLSEVVIIMTVHKKALEKLGLKTVEDLLYYFPTRYGNTSQMKNIESLNKGDNSTIFGECEVIFSLRLLFAGDYFAVVFCKYPHIFSDFHYPRCADEYRVQGTELGLDVRFERFALPAIRIPLHFDIHKSECLLARHFVADLF